VGFEPTTSAMQSQGVSIFDSHYSSLKFKRRLKISHNS
jgi:hypothetical protein